MMPARRVRAETLWVQAAEGPPVALQQFRGPQHLGERPSQRQMAVAPDGRTLAYADAGSDRLVVRRADETSFFLEGSADRDVRFSPDGRLLAAIVHRDGDLTVAVADVETGAARTFGRLAGAEWLEWTRLGVVVWHRAPGGFGHVRLLGLDGTSRLVAQERSLLMRGVAAGNGTRIGWFSLQGSGVDVHTLDLAHRDAPTNLGRLQRRPDNAEMAADGSEMAFATSQGLFHWQQGVGMRLLDDLPDVHSLWYAPDGRLAWANRARVVVRDGPQVFRLEVPEDDVQTMRLQRAGRGVVVVRETQALAWTPGTPAPRLLATAPVNESMQYADLWQGRAVWSTVRMGGMVFD